MLEGKFAPPLAAQEVMAGFGVGKSAPLVTAAGTRPPQRKRRDARPPSAAHGLAFLTALGHGRLAIVVLAGLVQRLEQRRQVHRHDRGVGELALEVVKELETAGRLRLRMPRPFYRFTHDLLQCIIQTDCVYHGFILSRLRKHIAYREKYTPAMSRGDEEQVKSVQNQAQAARRRCRAAYRPMSARVNAALMGALLCELLTCERFAYELEKGRVVGVKVIGR